MRHHPLRPGDVFRLRRGIPLSRVDDTLDFLRVHYDTQAPGLARVLEVTEGGVLLSLWGHRFRTTDPAALQRLRALGGFALWLAPERLGETILAREVRNGRVVMNPLPRPSRQRLVRLWLRRTRGPLPLLEALGGRVRPPVLRWLKSALFRQLAKHGLMPPAPGFLDHGMLVDRIGRTVMLCFKEIGDLISHIPDESPHLLSFVMVMLACVCRPDAAVDLTAGRIDRRRRVVILNPEGRPQTNKYRPIVKLTETLEYHVGGVTGPVVAFEGRQVKSIRTAWRALRADGDRIILHLQW